jgi:putative addiction module killer protein
MNYDEILGVRADWWADDMGGIAGKVEFAKYSFIDENKMYEIRHYLTPDARDVYSDWLKQQRDIRARMAIDRRVMRLEQGNFGDHKFCRDGVWELRVDVGAGYRLYYAIAERQLVLLLCGGDKRTQDADINRACSYWQDWQRRSSDER